jgi:hypothetical protein
MDKGGERQLRKSEVIRDREYFRKEILSYLVGFSKLLRDVSMNGELLGKFLRQNKVDREEFLILSIGIIGLSG